MSPHAQWTSAIIGVSLALSILLLVRRDRLQIHYALWWLSVAVGALILGFFPKILDKIGNFLGIHYPPILLVIISLALLFVKSLTQDLDRCRREQQLRRLIQRVAILEAGLESVREEETPREGDQEPLEKEAVDQPTEITKVL